MRWFMVIMAVMFLACQSAVTDMSSGDDPPTGQEPPGGDPPGEDPPPGPDDPPPPPPPPPPPGEPPPLPPPPAEPPAPPANAQCEAVGGAQCWWVDARAASDGDGSQGNPFRLPETAAQAAGPGDFIYLHGLFTFDHAVPDANNQRNGQLLMSGTANSGTAGALITMKPWPGSQAIVLGDPANQQSLSISIGGSYWRVEGIQIYGGYLMVAWYFRTNVHDVWLVNNDVCCAVAPDGNTGLIRLHYGSESGGAPYNIFVYENEIHDLFGCVSDATTACQGATLLWSEDDDVEHHSCFMIQNASGLVEFVDNVLYRCAAAFYFKYDGPGPTLVQNNQITDMTALGRCRSAQKTFVGNAVADIIRDPASQTSDRCDSD